MNSITIFEKREALRRLLESRTFAKARKASRFLEFVCEQSLHGNADKLNEYLIGVEVYERGSDFDPQQDAIVRVQAHEIRRKLREYYQGEGQDDPLRVDIPTGHYVPEFIRANSLPETTAAFPAGTTPVPRARAKAGFLRRNALAIVLGATCVLLAVLLVRERYSGRPAEPTAHAPIPESLDWFWHPFLSSSEPPLVVLPNHPFLRLAHDGDSVATVAQGIVIPKESVPAFRGTMQYRELSRFCFVPTLTDYTAVGEALGILHFRDFFDRMGVKMQAKQSRLVDYEMVKRANTILLGGSQAWSGRIFLYPEGFWFRAGVIYNKNPRLGELPVYKPEFDPITDSLRKDYALVLMLANERKDQRILLVYGIYTQGSQAAIEYVSSEEHLVQLRSELVALSPDRKTIPNYFQVLLETTVENYVPGKASFVAARIIPNELAHGMPPQ